MTLLGATHSSNSQSQFQTLKGPFELTQIPLRVCLAKNHTLCHVGKNFFSGNWVRALWLGPPRPKNPLPPPPRACGGRFSISGLHNPVSRRFSFFIFSLCFSAYLPRYTPQSSWFGPKKILAPIFLEIFHFLFSKVESASVYASGSKTHVATPPRVPRITKIQKKILFSFRWWHYFFVLLPKKRVRAVKIFFQPAILVFPSASPQKAPRANQTESYFSLVTAAPLEYLRDPLGGLRSPLGPSHSSLA